jgi:hypothetical protein
MANKTLKLLHSLKDTNLSYRIKLRNRQKMTHLLILLYLDYFENYKRETLSLGISITEDDKNQRMDENKLNKALQIRHK